MVSKFFLIYILFIPFFGKFLNTTESIVFHCIPLLVVLFLALKKQKIHLSRKTIIAQLILIFLYYVSTVFSKNIGSSYYQFFIFLNVIFTLSIAVNIIKPDDFIFYFIIVSFGYSVVFLLYKFGVVNLENDIAGDNFISQIWGHSYISEFIVLTIPILFNKFFSNNLKNKDKLILLIVSFIILLSLYLSNSRSAIIALILGLICFKANTKTIKLTKIFLIILSGIILVFIFNKIQQTKIEQKTYDGNRIEYWQQAIEGFKQSPIIGNGPNTFSYINKKFQKDNTVFTPFAHSSLLNIMSENGVIFTLIFFIFIIKSLIITNKKNHIFFICGLIALIFSLIDFSWNSPGILIISLYFIFYYSLTNGQKSSSKSTYIYLGSISTLLVLFIFSKTLSDIFFTNGKYDKSIIANPFNLNSYLEIIKSTKNTDLLWQKSLSASLKIYSNEIELYTVIVNAVPNSQKEYYYQKIIDLNPAGSDNYLQLISYYNQNGLNEKTKSVFQQISKNILIDKLSREQKVNLSKSYYYHAVKTYLQNPEDSILFFEKATTIMPILGYFQVDLANAYWHTNQIEKAFNQLENICQQYPEPKKQCQEYLQSHQNSKFNHPGEKDFINFIDNQF